MNEYMDKEEFKEEFKKEIKKLKMAFPSWQFDLRNKNQLNLWLNLLNKKIKKGMFEKMIDKYIETEFRYPTIASILKIGKDYGFIERGSNGKDNFI